MPHALSSGSLWFVPVAALLCLTALPISAAASGAPGPAATGAHLTWTELSPITSPSPRNWVAMAYDAHDGYVVAYGGYDAFAANRLYTDTWTFNGTTWTPLNLSTHPTASTGLVLAYDPALSGVLAFGGQAAYGSAYYNDTWLFSNGAWTQLHPKVSPPARSQYAMAYDAYDREMVLFGGTDGVGRLFNDTWSFNGSSWALVPAARHPAAREFGSLVFDPLNNLTLLVGGQNQTVNGTTDRTTVAIQPSTWAFQSGRWRPFGDDGGATARIFPYVSTLANGTPVEFGGQRVSSVTESLHGTYEFFGFAWHKVAARTPPSPRNNGGFAYDPKLGGDVLFGGRTPSGYDDETWLLT